ncbi:MAG: ABC transporter ATP-binding protein [Firmicutes bacterium]|nr:ABC transporter ATP-binding protein [Bacillota bacterium]
MITFRKVNLAFGDTVVLQDFSADFQSHKIHCILGPSGCGKTTLLNLLSGTLLQDSGEISKPQNVSYVFQEDLLIPQKTARQNLELVLKSAYKDKARLHAVIAQFLQLTGLESAKDLYPHELSGGMRQRLALIRAFAYPSDILLMDEPFKALDKTRRESLIKSFLSLYNADKRTVLFVTHSIDEALLTGDVIYVYSDKPMTLQKSFTVDEPPEMRKLYGESLTKLKNEIYKETEKWAT